MARKGPHDIITEGGAVGVLLSNRAARVWVDQADFARIVSEHGNRTWAWVEAARYVKLKIDQKVSVSVARLVVGEAGRFIRYADGDRLNLRRENLTTEEPVQPGPRKKREQGLGRAPTAPKVPKAAPSRSFRGLRPQNPLAAPVQAPTPSPPVPTRLRIVKRSPHVVGTVKRQPIPPT